MSLRFLSLSDAADRFEVETSDGARLVVYEAGGPRWVPALLVGHANGLAAGSYGPWLRDLARDFRVFAFDARGHGGSSWPDGPLESVFAVDRLADDLAEIVAGLRARLGGTPLHFAGHSLAAAAAVRLAVRGAELPFDRITLFEPPIFPPRDALNYPEAIEQQERLIRGAGRRQARWESPEALFAYLRSRGVFRSFVPEMLAAHCRATLKPDAAGGCVLCCAPAVESAIFAVHKDADTWQHLARVRQRLYLVSGDASAPDRDWVSGAMAGIVARIPSADLVSLSGTGHMMIFQRPDACRELLLRGV
ncbi:MAG TPA: alpha/beta hydrolase [Stellaceae bacterium]|jgi:pimeloyl-ACP methyl ester carboxylesterase|nr:alpha/beta hydrolase [Stellaceae bacterium]